MSAARWVAKLRIVLHTIELASRPFDPETEQALGRRWRELPEAVRTPAQLLGQRSSGCEGTHGVFPRCNFACYPCYHSKDANQVRTDAQHTLSEIDQQMRMLRERRGVDQHAQLIGGEVTLLGPEAHAQALLAMQRHRRKPMSMTHGDFDYDYLKRLALSPDGTRRFEILRFAGHFDCLMRGRRGISRPQHESDLHPYRRAFVANFERLEREHGVRFDLAHSMTVTPRNLGEVAGVVRACAGMRFGMLAFQPAAYVGNPRRWREDFHAVSIDAVWREIERGLGRRVPWQHVQMGDPRCNRSSHGVIAGGRWTPLLDDRDPRDLRVRDLWFHAFRSINLERPGWALAVAIARVLAHNAEVAPAALGWGWRFAHRAGLGRLLLGHPRALTLVVHAFMDAEVVRAAWAAMQKGEQAADPRVRAAQERLAACSYAMAHPETGELVPGCVQHCVLDPAENAALLGLLPVVHARRTGPRRGPSSRHLAR